MSSAGFQVAQHPGSPAVPIKPSPSYLPINPAHPQPSNPAHHCSPMEPQSSSSSSEGDEDAGSPVARSPQSPGPPGPSVAKHSPPTVRPRLKSSDDGRASSTSTLDGSDTRRALASSLPTPSALATPVQQQYQQPSLQSVVGKAKLAARSLFIILHAQSCRNDSTCSVAGCASTKKVLLHLRHCSSNSPCPHPGCSQTRKLLHHYRSCRTLRARASKHKPHQCLVCSLLAREVRAHEVASRSAPSPSLMPPPPPRQPTRAAVGPEAYGSPPAIPVGMARNIQGIARLASPDRPGADGGGKRSLGKSLDSASSAGSWMDRSLASSGSAAQPPQQRDRSVSAGSITEACANPPSQQRPNAQQQLPPAPVAIVRRRSSSCGVIRGLGLGSIEEEDEMELRDSDAEEGLMMFEMGD